MTTPATANMTQLKEFNNANICLSLTTHLLYKNRWRTRKSSQCTNKFSTSVSSTTPTQVRNKLNDSSNHSPFLRFNKQQFWKMVCFLMLITKPAQASEATTAMHKTKAGAETSSTKNLHSQLLFTSGQISMFDSGINNTDDALFRRFVPNDPMLMSHNALIPSDQLPSIDTDLKNAALSHGKSKDNRKDEQSVLTTAYVTHQSTRKQIASTVDGKQRHSNNLSLTNYNNKARQFQGIIHKHEQSPAGGHPYQHKPSFKVEQNEISKHDELTTELKYLENLLAEYATTVFGNAKYVPTPGILLQLQNNASPQDTSQTRSVRQTKATDLKISMDVPRTLATGRLLFLTGLKKVLWPVFMGLQVLKSLLIAMFIPALIGSFTKLLGKGITTSSAPLFIRPMDPPQELDFRDNSLHFDDEAIRDNGPYAYSQPDASQMNNEYVFDPSPANNQYTYTRLGMNERQQQLMQDSYMSALQSIGSASFKNSGSLSSGSSGLIAPMAKRPPSAANVNTFQQFQNVPESSLLLSNYDPFYSPLLSRLDSVFAQLKLNSDKEACREKLICLMYASPAKYAPYSNLVSAQLSRELNELRKPTSDNPDILRFFKYMRAAKDGQDGVDCEKTFEKCTEFKDFENPAMVSTYHDINKLVQARRLK